jgi:hypothetical protein
MKKCLNCNVNEAIKYSKYTNGNFCSSKCARSFSTKENRNEINKRVSEKLRGKTPNRDYSFSIEKWNVIREKRRNSYDKKIMNYDFSDLGIDRRKRRVLLEQKFCCNRCGLSEWEDEKIPLEIEHIDGDNQNNERDNLIALCPNCHALTKTWRGRNKKNMKNKISDDDLMNALIQNSFNIRQALLFVGLAAKGGNYKRCYRLKREYDETIEL